MTTSPGLSSVPNFGQPSPPGKRVLWKWSLAVTAVVLILLLWQCGSALVQGRRLADTAVQHFHEQLNNGEFAEIYGGADEGFRNAGKREEALQFLKAVHDKLGTAGQYTFLNINVNTNTHGTFITTVYNTTFARGRATERFIWVRHGATLALYTYNIESPALVVN